MLRKHGFIFQTAFDLIFFMSSAMFAQYDAEKVMEKSFERMDFFFDSNYLNPYGMGQFTTATPGLIEDTMLNLIINPAYGFYDSTRNTYLFLDFRNTRNQNDEQPVYFYPGRIYYDSYYYPYPRYYVDAHKAVEPVFSGAIFTKPLVKLIPDWFIGLTYQVMYQDEKYYQIPQDIYRSNIGMDYAGNKMVADEAGIPITDRYSGADDMHQKGHMLSFFTGYDIAHRIQVGLKAAHTNFSRNGSYGSRNYWNQENRYRDESLDYRMESRDQDYKHWDMAGGINIKLNPTVMVGAMFGYLWGDVTQSKSEENSYYYSYGTENVLPEWSYYLNSGNTQQDWKHNGSSYYGGLNTELRLSPQKTLILFYQHRRQNVDISLQSNVQDSSYSSYRDVWTDYTYESQSDYGLTDDRMGNGKQRSLERRFGASFRWQIEDTKKLNLGFVVHSKRRTISTVEHVLAYRHSWYYYESTYDNYINDRFDGTDERKALHWEFAAEQTSIHIPIIFTWQVARTVDLMMGIDRTMTEWEISDKTLAIFDHRDVWIDYNFMRKTNFGERYTQPRETMTDTNTALLSGVTIKPSELFNIRLLVVPNFENTNYGTDLVNVQWWIGLNLYP
ncbi:hypothetical protein JW960_18080 [candidate division KSB1 bacterium]|nr:hypothetical protein [candidate division KSB1 bacterium]